MEKCTMSAMERAQLERMAADTEDPLLAIALQLVLRGADLPAPVIQRVLNACVSLLDAHDAARNLLTRKLKR